MATVELTSENFDGVTSGDGLVLEQLIAEALKLDMDEVRADIERNQGTARPASV